jgi:hypothetical protein
MEAQEPEAEGVEAAIAGGRWHGRVMSIVVGRERERRETRGVEVTGWKSVAHLASISWV